MNKYSFFYENFQSQCFNNQLAAVNSNSSSEVAIDLIASIIPEFNYEYESGHTFDASYKCWEDTFLNEFTNKDDVC